MVQSADKNPALCVIDCEGTAASPHRGVYCHSGEGLGSQLRGVTIRHGYAEYGGGVSCVDLSSPIIDLCTFTENAAVCGGAISLDGSSSPEITACVFSGDTAQSEGGAIYCRQYSSPLIKNCLLTANSAPSGGAIGCTLMAAPIVSASVIAGNAATAGGALSSTFSASPRLTGCTLVANAATNGGGISCTSAASFRLENSILALSPAGSSVYCNLCSSTYIRCCDLSGNLPVNVPTCIQSFFGTGQANTTLDPQFCGIPGSGNYGLQSDSPCAPGNHPMYLGSCPLIGALPVACGTVSTRSSSWGTVKRIFR